MQSRGTSQAPTQRPSQTAEQIAAGPDTQSQGEQVRQPASAPTDTLVGQTFGQLAEIMALSGSVKERYITQVKLTGQMAKAEWQLTARSLLIAAVLLVCFGVGVILIWAGMLFLLGVMVMQLSGSVAVTAISLLMLQFALLFWCWRSLSDVLTQAGFTKTWQLLQRIFSTSPEGSSHVD